MVGSAVSLPSSEEGRGHEYYSLSLAFVLSENKHKEIFINISLNTLGDSVIFDAQHLAEYFLLLKCKFRGVYSLQNGLCASAS